MWKNKIEPFLTKIEPPNWLMPILAITALFRLPSVFSPYYYGDEMIYLTLGNAIKKGITLYSQIHDNKTPFIYFIANFADNLFWFRAILLFWMLFTVIIFWHLTKTLFKENKLAQQISVIIFVILTTIPLLEGNIVNSELFLIGPIILGLVFILNTKSSLWLFIAGFCFSVAVLFKVPAIFDLPVIILFWLIKASDSKSFIDILKKSLIIFTGFAIPLALTFIWYFAKGAGQDYLEIAFLQNIGYLSTWAPKPQEVSFLAKNLPLIIKGVIVLIGLFVLRVFNKKLSKVFIIACVWLLTSLFAATLSTRPYPHYLIQSVPAISLLLGILITSPKFEQVLTIIPLTLALFVPVYYKFWYYPTAPYYTNFIKFASGNYTKDEYFTTFDTNTLENYDTARKVINMTMPEDKIFVWGEAAPTIYALTKRLPPIKYVANYHIFDYSNIEKTISTLTATPPSVVVILHDTQKPKELSDLLTKNYVLINNSSNSSEIWRLLDL